MATVLGVIAAVVAPYLFWRWYNRATREVYDGIARVFNRGLVGAQTYDKDYDYVNVSVPTYGSLLMRVAKERLRRLTGDMTLVTVTLRQTPFGKPYIATVIWPDTPAVESVADDNGGLALGGVYLLLGILSFIMLPHEGSAFVQHVSLYTSMFILVMGGYLFSAHHKQEVNLREGQSRFLGIPVGNGVAGLWMITAICAVLNAAIFWTPSILLLLGLNTAFALGSLIALIQKARS